MRSLFILMFGLMAFKSHAQVDESGEEPLVARVLALDTNVAIAKRFSEAVGSIASGYSLAFIDNETRFYVRYVYKDQDNQTLRIDYRFIMESAGDDEKAPKRAIVVLQKISGELRTVTQIYNFLFGASLTPERVMTSSTQGTPVKYGSKTCDFTFLPDDYEPGYWVMTFVR